MPISSAAPARPARILIVDDSAVMRALLRSVVASDRRLEVAGTASDGASALRVVESLRPDLVLLDVEMPVMDGLNTLRQMKARRNRIPVIMCSALTQRGAKVTIEALASGAADYVAKPFGQPSREAAVDSLARDLVPKILALTASAIGMQNQPAPHGSAFPPAPAYVSPLAGQPAHSAAGSAWPAAHVPALPSLYPASQPPQPQPAGAPPAVVLIGVSTGGPAALDLVLPGLPANFPLPVLIVQHMPELFTKMLAERLNGRCPLRVVEASAGGPVRAGTIYIARGDWHMEIAATSPSPASTPALRLTQEPPENHCRPAVDVLFRTGVAVYGARVLGVVLTGMGYDGLIGSRLIRDHGGTVLAQDEATSAVWGMPGAVAQAGLAHRILPLNAIAPEILRLAGRGQREAFELRESAV
ncbi:MAG TPA: chemotaxis response regulator protein-glutamate methylesterase [Acidobacteriaceae bacterium]|jgi:two-component system chemotaxis response regulator CheB|nr:chemotaxis response regulator protein-glutamate methylesterase [Acidobacteriaceae bacterium]